MAVNTFYSVAAYEVALHRRCGREASLARILRGALLPPQGAGRNHCRSACCKQAPVYAGDAIAARLRNPDAGREGMV